MIDFLSSWVQQIALAVVIASIFEMILPNGNLKKYIKMVLGLYVIFSIISPFVDSSALYDLNVDELVQNTNVTSTTSNTSMDNRIQDLYVEELKKDITKKVEENGYSVQSCKIDADFKSENSQIKEIYIKVSKNKSNIENVNKVTIDINSTQEENSSNELEILRKALSDYYQIDKEKIKIS